MAEERKTFHTSIPGDDASAVEDVIARLQSQGFSVMRQGGNSVAIMTSEGDYFGLTPAQKKQAEALINQKARV